MQKMFDKERLFSVLTGIGIGLMLSAAFAGIEKWAVTLGLLLVIFAVAARYFFTK